MTWPTGSTFARIEDLLADVDGLDLTVHGYESVRAINVFLDANPGAAEVFTKDYREEALILDAQGLAVLKAPRRPASPTSRDSWLI